MRFSRWHFFFCRTAPPLCPAALLCLLPLATHTATTADTQQRCFGGSLHAPLRQCETHNGESARTQQARNATQATPRNTPGAGPPSPRMHASKRRASRPRMCDMVTAVHARRDYALVAVCRIALRRVGCAAAHPHPAVHRSFRRTLSHAAIQDNLQQLIIILQCILLCLLRLFLLLPLHLRRSRAHAAAPLFDAASQR